MAKKEILKQTPEVRLVEMVKDGERVEVHPSCVKDHQVAGWTLAVSAEEFAAALTTVAQVQAAKAAGELVLMVKDGERAKVHPTCVKAHELAGWHVAPDIEEIKKALPAPETEPKAEDAPQE